MTNLMLRGLVVYITLIVAVRLMGKRQIGELQPSELVTTFLLSEVASLPLQDKDISLIACLALIFMIVSLEIIFSVLAVKSDAFRTLMQGSSALIIKDGKLLQKKLKDIRYSIDDLLEGLRLKDVYDISQIKYAYIETNGSLSICLKEAFQPLTPKDIKLAADPFALPCLVISDGRIIRKDFELCCMTDEKLQKILRKKNLKPEEVFIMTADSRGGYNIIRKESAE